jgi:hypothetical protein
MKTKNRDRCFRKLLAFFALPTLSEALVTYFVLVLAFQVKMLRVGTPAHLWSIAWVVGLQYFLLSCT